MEDITWVQTPNRSWLKRQWAQQSQLDACACPRGYRSGSSFALQRCVVPYGFHFPSLRACRYAKISCEVTGFSSSLHNTLKSACALVSPCVLVKRRGGTSPLNQLSEIMSWGTSCRELSCLGCITGTYMGLSRLPVPGWDTRVAASLMAAGSTPVSLQQFCFEFGACAEGKRVEC